MNNINSKSFSPSSLTLLVLNLIAIQPGNAFARVDWRSERAYQGGGSELEAGLIFIALFVLGYFYIKHFSFTICAKCKLKTRGEAKHCKHCGSELPKYN